MGIIKIKVIGNGADLVRNIDRKGTATLGTDPFHCQHRLPRSWDNHLSIHGSLEAEQDGTSIRHSATRLLLDYSHLDLEHRARVFHLREMPLRSIRSITIGFLFL